MCDCIEGNFRSGVVDKLACLGYRFLELLKDKSMQFPFGPSVMTNGISGPPLDLTDSIP